MQISWDSSILQAQKPGRSRIVSRGCDPLIILLCFQTDDLFERIWRSCWLHKALVVYRKVYVLSSSQSDFMAPSSDNESTSPELSGSPG